MPDKVIREDTFTTRDQPEKHQFDLWREQIAPLIDVWRPNDGNAGFLADAKGYDVGKILFAQAILGPEAYEHSNDHIRKAESSHWVLTARKRGFAVSRSGDRVCKARRARSN